MPQIALRKSSTEYFMSVVITSMLKHKMFVACL